MTEQHFIGALIGILSVMLSDCILKLISHSSAPKSKVDCLRTDCVHHDWPESGFQCTKRRIIINCDGRCDSYIPNDKETL